MSKSFKDSAKAVLEIMRASPLESIVTDMRGTYPGITLEDAQRIRDGLIAIVNARTRAEQERLEAEQEDLHRELKKRYKDSGGR